MDSFARILMYTNATRSLKSNGFLVPAYGCAYSDHIYLNEAWHMLGIFLSMAQEKNQHCNGYWAKCDVMMRRFPDMG